MSGSDAPTQVDNPDYHNVEHTAVQTCGWTKNALNGEYDLPSEYIAY